MTTSTPLDAACSEAGLEHDIGYYGAVCLWPAGHRGKPGSLRGSFNSCDAAIAAIKRGLELEELERELELEGPVIRPERAA